MSFLNETSDFSQPQYHFIPKWKERLFTTFIFQQMNSFFSQIKVIWSLHPPILFKNIKRLNNIMLSTFFFWVWPFFMKFLQNIYFVVRTFDMLLWLHVCWNFQNYVTDLEFGTILQDGQTNLRQVFQSVKVIDVFSSLWSDPCICL